MINEGKLKHSDMTAVLRSIVMQRQSCDMNHLLCAQVIFRYTDNGDFIPDSVRVNAEVKCRIEAKCDYLYKEGRSSLYDINTIYKLGLIEEEECYKDHITSVIHKGITLTSWAFPSVDTYQDLSLELKRQHLMNEEEFLGFVSMHGYNVSQRTIENYRKCSLFPDPEKILHNTKRRKFYHPEDIKYIKHIKKLKRKMPKGMMLKDMRVMDEKFFKDIPYKIYKGREPRKRALV